MEDEDLWQDNSDDLALAKYLSHLEEEKNEESLTAEQLIQLWDEDDSQTLDSQTNFKQHQVPYMSCSSPANHNSTVAASNSDGLSQADRISMTGNVTDPSLELLDPNPNIWNLFQLFDHRFFEGILTRNAVSLIWSKRMTLTAGLCRWSSNSGVEIKLSQPLLSLRPRKDLVETLIHEMIHAVLFVKKQDDNHESHGEIFHSHMFRINKEAGCRITVYHNFHDEVHFYQKHVWKCNGPCVNRSPYYGILRRAQNRPPGPTDYWWSKHQRECGGCFIKIAGPEMEALAAENGVSETKTGDKTENTVKGTKRPGNTKKKTPTKRSPLQGVQDIRNFFTTSPDKNNPQPTCTFIPPRALTVPSSASTSSFTPFSGEGRILGSTSIDFFRETSTNKTATTQPHRETSKTLGAVRDLTSVIEVIELD